MENSHKVVEKPWGKEEWISLTKNYCFKRITLWKGCKTSLQYHKHKEETTYIESGRAVVWYCTREETDSTGEPDKLSKREVGPGFKIYLRPGDVHRFEALEDVVMFEASTIEVDDVVRLEDSYGRQDQR